ncbi:MAG TPA: DUF58 domain-containing protein [Blastocatellia bacterium]|nr:DUF58 domain-containing protein [Blastocatellia bacterium]
MNRQAWRDFFITVFFLGLAFIIALLSSAAADQNSTHLAAAAAAVSLLLALIGALYIIPRLARNVRLEILRFAIRTSFTIEGLLFVVFLIIIGFAAWNAGNNLLYLVLSAMLAFLIAANLIARISLADMAIQLRFPDHIFAGEPANISVTLLNHKRLMPSYSLMIEALSDEDAVKRRRREGDDAETDRQSEGARGRQGDRETGRRGDGATRTLLARSDRRPVSGSGLGKLAYFVLVPARSSARQRSEHTFERRGRYPITGFRIATKFPAGFFKKWRRIDAAGEILVYPKPQPLDDFYHALPMLAGQIQSHARGSGDDLYAIRRYHPSDHIRNIDWKATAKSMQMMVREHMREDEWRLTIVFDTTISAIGPRESELRNVRGVSGKQAKSQARESIADDAEGEDNAFQDRFERAVLMAASLANHFIMERAEVELITTGEKHDVASGSGYEHLYKILGSLATLEPTEPESGSHRAEGRRPKADKWAFLSWTKRRAEIAESQEADTMLRKPIGGITWRLLDDVPVLRDDRRFKVLITSARKGTIPAHVWRSAHVVFMEDL